MASPYAEFRVLEPKATLTGAGNPHSLANVITEPLPDGAMCYVIDVGDWFVLDKSSTATVFPPEVIAAASGGRWVQLASMGQLLSFDTVAEFRAHPPLQDLTVFYIADKGLFVYRATEGAGEVDDGLFTLRPTAVLLAQNGRAYALSTAASAPSAAAVRTGTNLAKSMTVAGSLFEWSTSADPLDDTGNEFTDVIAVTGNATGAYQKVPAAQIIETPLMLGLRASSGVTATGTDIDSWIDLERNITVPATGAARPTYLPTGFPNGGPAVRFDGADDRMDLDAILPYIQGDQPRSMSVYHQPSSVAGSHAFFGGAGLSGTLMAIQQSGTSLNVFNTGAGEPSLDETTSIGLATSRASLLMVSHVNGANQSKIFFEGREYVLTKDLFNGTYQLVHASLGSILSAGGYVPATFYAGMMQEFELYSGPVTAANYIAKCIELFGHKYINIVGDGNSLMVGSGTTGGMTMPFILGRTLGVLSGKVNNPQDQNLGVGSQTTTQMISDFGTQVAPLVRPHAFNILLALEVGNDILAGATARQAVDHMWQYAALGFNAGYDAVITYTVTNRTTLTAPQWTEFQAANTLMRSERRDHVTALVEPDLAWQFQDPTNTNFFPDGIHYSNSGASVLAMLTADACRLPIASAR